MRRRCIVFAVFAGVAFQAAPALAQTVVPPPKLRGAVTTSWQMAVPVYSFRNVQRDVSFRGFAVDAHYLLHPMSAVGGGMSIQHYVDRFPERTVERGNSAVTAQLDEYTQTWQFTGTIDYFPLGSEQIAPYVGAGFGYAWINRYTLVTDFSVQDTAEGFAFTPELGLLFRPGWEPAGLTASVRYNFTTASPDRVDSLSFVSWTVGGFFGF